MTTVLSRTRALVLGLVVLILVAVLAVGVAALARTVNTEHAIAANRDELRSRAGRILADVFSVDARHWSADRARARGLVGPEFAESYGAQLYRAPAAGTVAIVWRPEAVGLVDVALHSGEVLIRVAVTTSGTARPEPTTIRQSVLTRFVKTGDRWLLDRAEVIG